ncbi:MAG: hypothetical protein L3J07_02060 [Candidatus Magasanikbacteria bacterium]|nr:hypothetical protein [Candidatus Magasanikbacteria bacterium]
MDDQNNNSSSFLMPFSPIQEEESNDEVIEKIGDKLILEETTNPNNFSAVEPDHSTEEKTTREPKEENWNSLDGLYIAKSNIKQTSETKADTLNYEPKLVDEILEKEKDDKEVEQIADKSETPEPEEPPTPTEEKPLDKEKIKSTILLMQSKLNEILNLLDGTPTKDETISTGNSYTENGHRVVEGLFNGTAMVGPDGHEYSIPANYASKSRLVDGDSLKLSIKENGSFVYKQIKPTERKRITGTLVHDEENDQWIAMHDGKSIKVLNASISFYKGKSGDDVVLLVPKEKESEWGAVENIIKKSL